MDFIHRTETKVFAVCSKCKKSEWIGTNISFNRRAEVAEKFGFRRDGDNLICSKCDKKSKQLGGRIKK